MPRRSSTVRSRSRTSRSSTASHAAQRSTRPGAGPNISVCASAHTRPHPAHRTDATVASAANTSASNYGNLLPTYVVVALIYILINLALGWFSHWLERKLRTRRGGGKVVQIDPAAQSDLMAARQQIEILDAPGIDEFKKS